MQIWLPYPEIKIEEPIMQNPTSRRNFIKNATLYLTVIAAGTSLATLSNSAQATSISKTDAGYQDTPKSGLQCKDCYYFNAGISANENTCKRGIVAPISAHGYCNYCSPKS